MDSVIAFLEKLVSFEVSPGILAGIAVVVEFSLRMVKSEKPLGLIHSVAGVVKKAGALVGLVAGAIGKLADLSDKVLPQKSK